MDEGTVENHIRSDDRSLSLGKGSQPSQELKIQRCQNESWSLVIGGSGSRDL